MSLSNEGAGRPLWLLTEAELPVWLAAQPEALATWVRVHGFQAERHRTLALPAPDGSLAGVAVGLGALPHPSELTLWHAAALPDRLPRGHYALATALTPSAATRFALGWLTGAYRMARYRSSALPTPASLSIPQGADIAYARAAASACALARDLINTPANDLGPAELAQAGVDLAARFGAQHRVLGARELEAQGYPLIRAVGAGSPREPRLLDLRWGDATAPRVTLVGKGVCFDTGGLDLKPSAAMLLMKKDMGGAACVLGLAQLLLELAAPIELRLLIPAVDNAVGSRAYRPGDVWRSRKGLTVEIGNTDAEGRLVLADALCDADAEQPDLLIDLATLTGAARTALGPDLPAVFASEEGLARQLAEIGRAQTDPLWPMPLWMGYDDELGSRIADLNNVAQSGLAGAIFGALFLRRFVTASWLHVDLYAWNSKE